jgi:hypothetical protein
MGSDRIDLALVLHSFSEAVLHNRFGSRQRRHPIPSHEANLKYERFAIAWNQGRMVR